MSSTYFLFAASVSEVGVATFVIFLLPISTSELKLILESPKVIFGLPAFSFLEIESICFKFLANFMFNVSVPEASTAIFPVDKSP